MDDVEAMQRALELAGSVRAVTSPNPWVGSVVATPGGEIFEGATAPPGGPHAEVAALAEAGARARGGTLYATLEPCAHHGRTPPCVEAILAAGIARVVIATGDPDPHVAGRGLAQLRAAGITVDVGLLADRAERQLAPYLKHRRTGRPWVVLKLAATLDGGSAAPDGTSRWITGPTARADVHRLRAESDAVLVGAGTVRSDDPELTVRRPDVAADRQPLRVVLGRVAPEARVQPCLELDGDLGEVLDTLGGKGVIQVLVEGGATVAGAFHRAGLVDRYVVYLAPALFGGEDARGLLAGPGAATVGDLWRGRMVDVQPLGDDLRIDFEGLRDDLPNLEDRGAAS